MPSEMFETPLDYEIWRNQRSAHLAQKVGGEWRVDGRERFGLLTRIEIRPILPLRRAGAVDLGEV